MSEYESDRHRHAESQGSAKDYVLFFTVTGKGEIRWPWRGMSRDMNHQLPQIKGKVAQYYGVTTGDVSFSSSRAK